MRGKKVWVLPKMNTVNFGTNIAATKKTWKGMIPQDSKEAAINAHGMTEFFSRADRYLEDRLKEVGDYRLLRAFEEITEESKHVPRIKQARAKLDATKDRYGDDLNREYQNYQRLLHRYQEFPLEQKKLKKEIAKIEKNIRSIEKSIDAAYKNLQKEERKVYLKIEENLKHREATFQIMLEELRENEPDLSQKLNHIKEVKHHSDEVKRGYYHKVNLKPQTVMQIQTNFVQANSLMNNYVTFFCKSATDRTGRVENKILEEQIFYSLHGRYPTNDPQDQQLIVEIAKQVNQYGASWETGKLNRGMPGLQIGLRVNPELGVFAKIGRMHASLAKGIYH